MSEWTPVRIEQLTELWAQGYSASQVAKKLGGVTRNAVIGKVHREGLEKRGRAKPAEPKLPKSYTRPKKVPRAPVQAAGIKRRALSVRPVTAPVVVDATMAKPWTERRFGECAYPISGEGSETWSCCVPSGDHGYCAAHRARMFVPAKKVLPTAKLRGAFHNSGSKKAWAA